MKPASLSNSTDVQIKAQPGLMDVLIRLAVVFALAWLCYLVLSPFLTLAVWSIILAVTLYPLHQAVARRVWNKQWLASLIVVVAGLLLIVVPLGLLVDSFADSVRGFVTGIQNGTLEIPPPSEGVHGWPVVGEKIYGLWSQAYNDLPGLVQTMQPKLGELARVALGAVASAGTTVLMFLAAFIVASIVMAYGESGDTTTTKFFTRLAGPKKGPELAKLSTATIRTVAFGVIGVAAIQALLIGISLLVAGVPAAGVLAIIVLVLGIAQVPAAIVVLPAIVYIWASGNYTSTSAAVYTVLLLVMGLADNVLKPLMLGRGVDVPMPVILFGALGGVAAGGILGMFVGATALALGYGIFMAWISDAESKDPVAEVEESEVRLPESAKAASAE
jgi:predicted PurR-regulated permease PerM